MYADVKKEKINKFAYFHSTQSYLRRSGRQQFASASRLSIRGSFHRPWTLALKLLPSTSPQIRAHGTERFEFRFFFILMSVSDIQNLNLPPSVPRDRICGDPEGNNFNAGVRGPTKLPLIDRQQALANCCLPDRRKYNGVGRKRANLVFFSFLTLVYV